MRAFGFDWLVCGEMSGRAAPWRCTRHLKLLRFSACRRNGQPPTQKSAVLRTTLVRSWFLGSDSFQLPVGDTGWVVATETAS